MVRGMVPHREYTCSKILRESFESVTVSDSSVEPNEVRAVKRRLLLSTAMSSINFNYIADDVIRLALSRIRRSDVGDLVVHFEVVMFVHGRSDNQICI